MIKRLSFLFVTLFFAFVSTAQVRFVVLGSSTAYGAGASTHDSAWVYRYETYVKSKNQGNEVINLALGGYTTYHILPTGTTTPVGRPRPDTLRNITKALSHDPDAIIINLPSNDAAGLYTIEEQIANYDAVMAKAGEQGVPVWVATTQPRNMAFPNQFLLVRMRDSTYSLFGDKAIDFWTGITDTNTLADIDENYDSGDGIHLNDAGHRILFQRVVEKNIVGVDYSLINDPGKPVRNIQLYPNPARHRITIGCETITLPVGEVSIFDISGRLVYNQSGNWEEVYHEIDIAFLDTGCYSLVLKVPDAIYRGKFVKTGN